MTEAIWIFLGLTVTLAAVVVTYVVMVVGMFRRRDVEVSRGLTLFPVATPVLAWREGDRALPIVFSTCAVLYFVLQLVAFSRPA